MPRRVKGTWKHSEESKRKIGLALIGRPVSEKTRQRMRTLNKGKFGWNHPCYKESKKHSFHKQIRETFKYRQWRSDVFTRDNFTCVSCGARSGNGKAVILEADHIKRFIDIINEYSIKSLEEALSCEELWNINNGRTLCKKCHLNTGTWGRTKIK